MSHNEAVASYAELPETHRHSIRMPSGGWWDFLDPSNSKFTIEDIAHNLSREPRYNGGTAGDYAYTVAQHEVNASYIVAPEFAFETLHHDDAEFAYKDITTWLKRLIPDYRALLKQGEDFLNAWHGLPLIQTPEVKIADLQMLVLEKSNPLLFPNHQDDSPDAGFQFVDHIDVTNLEHLVDLVPWTPRVAKKRWLDRHWELMETRNV